MLRSHMSLGTVHEGKKCCYKVNVVAVCNVLRSVTEAAGTVSKKLTLVTISAHLWSMGKLYACLLIVNFFWRDILTK